MPIVVYHNFLVDSSHRYLPDQSFTDVSLFSAEMKYLHDNGFIVLKKFLAIMKVAMICI